DVLAVLGPSGCGKTTLLRCIAGFGTPDAGAIVIDGQTVFSDTVDMKPEKRHIGYVPQDGVLFPHMTVARNIGFGLPRGKQRQRRVAEMLELVGMAGLGDRMPHPLSGGQQQRVALARAVAPSPSLIPLDEACSALDAGLRASLREDVKSTLKKLGVSAIIVTHDQEEALSIADHVSVMLDGSCVQTADPVSLYKHPVDLRVAEFVGDATVFDAQVVNGCVISPFGKLPVCRDCPENCHCASVMIRPEQFVISRSAAGVTGSVNKIFFYGHDAMLHLALDNIIGPSAIQVRIAGHPEVAIGERVGLQVDGQ